MVGLAEAAPESGVQTVAIASDDRDGGAPIAWAAQVRFDGDCHSERRPTVYHDLRAADAAGPWRDEAIRLRLPLRRRTPAVGRWARVRRASLCVRVKSLPSTSPNHPAQGVADDLAFGIVALRTRVNRRQAEEALRTANERYARQEAALTTDRELFDLPGRFHRHRSWHDRSNREDSSVALVGVWRHDEKRRGVDLQDLFQ